MIAVTVATFVSIQPLPAEAEMPLFMPQNTILAKGLVSEVYLSGTVVTIPFDTFKNLSGNFLEQKIIIESKSASDGESCAIAVHYLGKDKDGFAYHATQEYSYFAGVDNIRIEGNTLKYHLSDNGWTGKVFITIIEAAVCVAIPVVGFWRRLKDC